MEPTIRNRDKILQLQKKGVFIPNPFSLDIDDDVNPDLISEDNVSLYPGCRLYGRETVISAGVQLGTEGPVTVDNCQLGSNVKLSSGTFRKSVFLQDTSMGYGASVREGCLLEEQASAAHCVGLKQTILFPFTTLGSLINFCDCLMAGGTSRQNHSEVGSSYVHFNFTPDGDKATPSLLGDVPKGVMLNNAPIFLGGQGGLVGPVRLTYGSVVAAGTVLNHDVEEEDRLIFGKKIGLKKGRFIPKIYLQLPRMIKNNILYLANLVALHQWYLHVRRLFFSSEKFSQLLYQGALDVLRIAIQERTYRFKTLSQHVDSAGKCPDTNESDSGRAQFIRYIDHITAVFSSYDESDHQDLREPFLEKLLAYRKEGSNSYLETICGVSPGISQLGTFWLDALVNTLYEKAVAFLKGYPTLNREQARLSQTGGK